jgi:hypothetical protein
LQALHEAILLMASDMEKKLGAKMDIDEGGVQVELPVIGDAAVPAVAPAVAHAVAKNDFFQLLEAT